VTLLPIFETRGRWFFLGFFLIFVALCVLIQEKTGAYFTDRGLGNDEAAHFVNSLLVFDYIADGIPSSPLDYAREYYIHFPRVSIGHWPPMFYIVQACIFGLFGRSGVVAIATQAAISALALGWIASLVRRRVDWLAGLAAGIAVLASPGLMVQLGEVMVDTFLALWLLSAALSWAAFAARPGAGRAAVFAVCAIGAIMTKGSGLALALLPLLHAALVRDARPLLDRRAWLAAAAIGATTLPWYWFTYRMAATGFNHGWGWDYTAEALPAFAKFFVAAIGAIGVIGFVAGAIGALRPRHGSADHPLAALVALVMVTMLFYAVVPADIVPRYVICVLPATMVVAAVGLARLLRPLAGRLRGQSGMVVAALLLVDAATLVRVPHVTPFRTDLVASQILHAESFNPLVLVAGSGRAEGALIATFAEADRNRRHFVLRGTQVLSSSTFMGEQYAPRFADTASVERWLADAGIGWVVVDDSPGGATMEHNRQVLAIAASSPAGWDLVESHRTADGEMRLYRLSKAMPSARQISAALQRVTPTTTITYGDSSGGLIQPTR
jgi:4-amino-4-deoxy-L-arabinose transferase-like glycosyltransferase